MKFAPWGHRRMLPLVFAGAGGGFPTGVQDVNEAHLLPVILLGLREWWFSGNKECACACSSTQQARLGRVRCTGMIPDADRCVAEWCGRMCVWVCVRAETCAHTLISHPEVAHVQWKWKREVGKKKEGSEETGRRTSVHFPEGYIITAEKICLNCMFFTCVRQDACVVQNFQGCDPSCMFRKMFHLNLIEHLFPEALTCACFCVFSWSSSDTCWSQSGWSINLALVFCACE